MAQRQKEWLAPMLFTGSCHTETVNKWLKEMLLPELTQPSVIVMDNARFHNKEKMQEILNEAGHIIYSFEKGIPQGRQGEVCAANPQVGFAHSKNKIPHADFAAHKPKPNVGENLNQTSIVKL